MICGSLTQKTIQYIEVNAHQCSQWNSDIFNNALKEKKTIWMSKYILEDNAKIIVIKFLKNPLKIIYRI